MSDNGSPAPEAKPEQLQIRLREEDGQEMEFRIKYTTTMKKVIDAFCKAKGVRAGTRRFFQDGRRINPPDTPESLGLENEDVVDVFLEQQGGGS